MLENIIPNKATLMKCINLIYTVYGRILNFIKANQNPKKPLYAKCIQKVFNLTRGTVSKYLTTFERLGLIEREWDGTGKVITMTDLGNLFFQ